MQRPDVESFIRIVKSVSEDSEWISGRSVFSLCNYILQLEREAAVVRNNALEEAENLAKEAEKSVSGSKSAMGIGGESMARLLVEQIRALKTQEKP